MSEIDAQSLYIHRKHVGLRHSASAVPYLRLHSRVAVPKVVLVPLTPFGTNNLPQFTVNLPCSTTSGTGLRFTYCAVSVRH
jgi:hypothetical protein